MLLLATALALPATATIDRWGYTSYLWQPTGEGPHYYNNAANWEDGHQPVTFEGAYFGAGTVTIPAATVDNPYTDGAGLFPYLSLLDRGGKFTIDASNTYWLKKYDSTDADRGYSFLAELSGGYFYGVEGLHYRSGNNAAEFMATNMVMEFSRAAADEDDGATMTLRQGYFNYYDPPGAEGLTFGPSMKFFNSGYGANRVVYEEGTHTRVRNLEYRGNSPDTLFWIKGGLHENFGNFDFKSQNNGNPGRMRISGGVYDQVAGVLTFPTATRGVNDDWTVSAYLTIDGTGALYATNTTTQIAKSGNGGIGVLSLSDYGEAHLRQVWMNYASGSIGRVEMSGNSFMDQVSRGETFALGMDKDSVGVFSMTDNARAELGNMRLGAWDNNAGRPHGYGELNLSGNAYLSVAEISAGRSLNSTGIVEIAGNAVMTTQGSTIFLGNDNSETYGRVSVSENGGLEHGHIYVANNVNTDADLIFSGSATNHVWQDNNNYILFLGKTSNSVGRAYFKDNTKTTFGQVRIAGDDSSQAHRTAKGEMHISDNASVKVNNQLLIARAVNSEGVLEISGGTLDMGSSQLTASEASNSFARIHMTSGKLQTAGNIVFDNGEYSTGSYYIGGDAQVEQTGGTTFIANGNHTDTTVTIGDDANVKWNIWVGGQKSHANGTIVVTNNATMALTGSWIGLALDSTNRIVVTDHAKMKFVGDVQMGWADSAESVNEIVVDQSGGLEGPDSGEKLLKIGGENYAKRSTSRLLLRGGVSQADTLNINLERSTNAVLEVSGGNHVFKHLYIYDQHVGVDTNTVRVTGGRVRFNDLVVIGNSSEHGRLEVGGGTFSTREINLGFGNTPAGMMSTMVVTGGVVEVVNNANDAWFQLGNGAGSASRGRLEQTGGEIRVHSIRANHSASGRSEAFFDGGKVVQSVKVHGTYGIIQGLTQAEVGATGLTIDSNGFASYVNQAFTDADDGNGGTVDGCVTVTGDGSLDVRLDSTHALTVVDGGTLTFSNGATVFGRRTVLKNGGVFSLAGDATSFAFDNLTIGDATSAGVLKLDQGDVITITGADGLEVVNCLLDVSHVTGNGSYTVFQTSGSGTIDPNKLGNITIKNADPFKSYTLNADGTMTVADRVFAETEWLGTQSSLWANDDNWRANAPVGSDSKAIFGNVNNKMVQTSDGATAGVLAFTSPNYVVYGSDAISVGVAIDNTSSGSVNIASPISLVDSLALTGTAGSETALAGALSGTDVAVTKSGSGKVTLSANNTGLDATWTVAGGTLDIASSGALGVGTEPVTLASGTLAYSDQTAATAPGALVVDAAQGIGAIIDTASDLTFTNVDVRSGRLVKKGAGTFKLDLPAGEFKFADVSDRLDNPGDDIVLPASGDSPATTAMFNSLSVIEGPLVVEGAGSNATKVVHKNGLGVGEPFAAAQTSPELVLRNVYFDNDVDAYVSVGRSHLSTVANEPWIKVLDGAYLYAQKMCVGWSARVATECGLAVTNATVALSNHIIFGEGAKSHARVRIGPEGKVLAKNTLYGRELMDVLVEGAGAELAVYDTYGKDDFWTWQGDFYLQNHNVRGTMTFRDGGKFRLGARIHGDNWYSDGTPGRDGVKMVFDGGVMEFMSGGTSIFRVPDHNHFVTTGEGMTIQVDAGAVHRLTFPIRGDGGLVKTGPGELVFTDVRAMTGVTQVETLFTYQYDTTDLMLGAYEGSTEVREGTLTLFNGMLTNTTAVTVGEAGALNLGGNSFEFPSVEGTGVISNGTLSAVVKVAMDKSTRTGAMPTFSDVTLPDDLLLAFEFDGDPEMYVPYTLAETGCDAVEMAGWRATCNGQKCRPVFSVDGSGRAVVYLRKMPGLCVTIR